MTGRIVEANIDTLVGPTHHFSGLGTGNIASIAHRHLPSSPKQAALEGLNKAWLVAQKGIPQFLLPPMKRPKIDLLANFGFRGTPDQQLRSAYEEDLTLLSAVYSSSFMWTANAATVTAASDSSDGKMHITIANLSSSLHRSIEPQERFRQLSFLFANVSNQVMVHPPLLPAMQLRDEGAANHIRFSSNVAQCGINVFVHGDPTEQVTFGQKLPDRFIPRHTRAASTMIQRLHRLSPQHTFHLQQHPAAISEGVFHNDVIATSHCNLFLFHEMAFNDGCQDLLRRIEDAFLATTGSQLISVMVKNSELSLSEAIRSYIFNCQIVSPMMAPNSKRKNDLADQDNDCQLPRMLLIAPHQCREVSAAEKLINGWIQSPEIPIEQVEYVDLRQSMAGGGGPACLRLRLPMREELLPCLPAACRLNLTLYQRLGEAIDQHYPNNLTIQELANWEFAEKAMRTVDILTDLLGFPA